MLRTGKESSKSTILSLCRVGYFSLKHKSVDWVP